MTIHRHCCHCRCISITVTTGSSLPLSLPPLSSLEYRCWVLRLKSLAFLLLYSAKNTKESRDLSLRFAHYFPRFKINCRQAEVEPERIRVGVTIVAHSILYALSETYFNYTSGYLHHCTIDDLEVLVRMFPTLLALLVTIPKSYI
ncbi:hypothetical protein F8388_001841 [Cannabis sativa]|uniref:Uncharacterized protein n=1 Tax=Cannabis sativa TaxID=3483 RepID=A0A7J6F075_CANSA|nr:hypothetical protein F8388_001841 [Cannabis sativa]